MPARRERRRLLLNEVALAFEPGIRYSEQEGKPVPGRHVYPDYAALRRYLVDEGLLARAVGQDWRSGN